MGTWCIGFRRERSEPLNQKIYGKMNEWRERPLVGNFPYVFLDGFVAEALKRSWGGEVKNVSVLVAIGVGQNGYREILAVSEGPRRTRPAGRTSCAS